MSFRRQRSRSRPRAAPAAAAVAPAHPARPSHRHTLRHTNRNGVRKPDELDGAESKAAERDRNLKLLQEQAREMETLVAQLSSGSADGASGKADEVETPAAVVDDDSMRAMRRQVRRLRTVAAAASNALRGRTRSYEESSSEGDDASAGAHARAHMWSTGAAGASGADTAAAAVGGKAGEEGDEPATASSSVAVTSHGYRGVFRRGSSRRVSPTNAVGAAAPEEAAVRVRHAAGAGGSGGGADSEDPDLDAAATRVGAFARGLAAQRRARELRERREAEAEARAGGGAAEGPGGDDSVVARQNQAAATLGSFMRRSQDRRRRLTDVRGRPWEAMGDVAPASAPAVGMGGALEEHQDRAASLIGRAFRVRRPAREVRDPRAEWAASVITRNAQARLHRDEISRRIQILYASRRGADASTTATGPTDPVSIDARALAGRHHPPSTVSANARMMAEIRNGVALRARQLSLHDYGRRRKQLEDHVSYLRDTLTRAGHNSLSLLAEVKEAEAKRNEAVAEAPAKADALERATSECDTLLAQTRESGADDARLVRAMDARDAARRDVDAHRATVRNLFTTERMLVDEHVDMAALVRSIAESLRRAAVELESTAEAEEHSKRADDAADLARSAVGEFLTTAGAARAGAGAGAHAASAKDMSFDADGGASAAAASAAKDVARDAASQAEAACAEIRPLEFAARASSAGDCVVCMMEPGAAVIAPCGHQCACADCARVLYDRGNPCPICRGPIDAIVNKVYTTR